MLTDRNVLQGWQSDRLNLLFLLSLGLLVLGAGLGLRDPWPADEPRFALVASRWWNQDNGCFHSGVAKSILISRPCLCGALRWVI